MSSVTAREADYVDDSAHARRSHINADRQSLIAKHFKPCM